MTLSQTFAAIRRKIASRRLRIAVLGDVMTDEWVIGEVAKLEQGGAAPVFRQGKVLRLPGGAGNVARQLEHANVEAFMVGHHEGLDDRCTRRPHQPMRHPIKRRFCTPDGRVLFRHDEEAPHYGLLPAVLAAVRQRCLGWLRHLIAEEEIDALILSDYGKGALDEATIRQALSMCCEARVRTVVDPWIGRASYEYHGCGVFKPNAQYMGRHGSRPDVFVQTAGEAPPWCRDRETLPTQLGRRPPVPCVNPVGAGDAFAAWLTVALCHGASLPDAAEWAYSAGRVYVQRPFAEPVRPHEVQADLDPEGAKVMEADELAAALRDRPGVVLANGCFDLLHAGHMETLAWARRQGQVLVAAVNTDESVRRLKGTPRPLLPLEERMACLAALACVDFVVSFGEDTPLELIRLLRPEAVVKGPDAEAGSVVAGDARALVAPPGRYPQRHTTALVGR